MLANQLTFKYAQAIYELAAESSNLNEVEQQLKLVESTFSGHTDLASFMYHPLLPVPAKKEIMNQVFAGELNKTVRIFLLLLIDKHRESALPAIIRTYIDLANEARNMVVANVYTAEKLTREQLDSLTVKLSKVTGKNILLKPTIDRELLGGVVVKIGDKLIDGSVANQLKKLKTALAANQAAIGL
ncbi:F0F1 ATP synthase subunit delta [Sporomusa acidovorans]|uniref:ATP synthase subunit delta n=1 Tax=Sporomusa acidovorans (strain ATCC 49682 / DSM 3132 / Mol) TaxID=1123286 RepID=A0ABZ3J5F2_SPOA4|nr:F0F1 ATP synthase subunit delta [Sporomusa acidovorans]OZC16349.1 ATP synthase subunit delta [Sporomusa acidovorans DSM 3132]SDF01236.1 ATP synthase F1 subcomplex delta subunit [Sporomusa acidovorans]